MMALDPLDRWTLLRQRGACLMLGIQRQGSPSFLCLAVGAQLDERRPIRANERDDARPPTPARR
jgi:hypothetical protein